jgi:hypothetical protein
LANPVPNPQNAARQERTEYPAGGSDKSNHAELSVAKMTARPTTEGGAGRYHNDDPGAYSLPLHTDILALPAVYRSAGPAMVSRCAPHGPDRRDRT